jgi:uncharacterized membrane protein
MSVIFEYILCYSTAFLLGFAVATVVWMVVDYEENIEYEKFD